MYRVSHWVNNKVVAGKSGKSGKVFNPATGEQQAEVDFADVAEVDMVVAAAKAAQPAWRATNLSRRAEIMFRMRELVDANRKEIASLLTLEHGKVPWPRRLPCRLRRHRRNRHRPAARQLLG